MVMPSFDLMIPTDVIVFANNKNLSLFFPQESCQYHRDNIFQSKYLKYGPIRSCACAKQAYL